MKLNKRMIESGGVQTVTIYQNNNAYSWQVSKTTEGFYQIYNLTTRKIVGTYSKYRVFRGVLADIIKQ